MIKLRKINFQNLRSKKSELLPKLGNNRLWFNSRSYLQSYSKVTKLDTTKIFTNKNIG